MVVRYNTQTMICPNPNYGKIHENVRGKCPHCGSDFHGHVPSKHAVQPRGLVENKCAHGIFRFRPCDGCERSVEDSEVYRRSILTTLTEWRVARFANSKSEAEKHAKAMLA